jgi:hypothetical protein
MFLPASCTVPCPALRPPWSAPQSSSAGSGSPVIATCGLNDVTRPFEKASAMRAFPVWPETRLRAPTVEGPNIVP